MDNTEIIIGFVENFKIHNPEHAASLSGHPIPGRVYRIIKTDDLYLVHVGATKNVGKIDGIALGDTLSGNFMGKWEFNIIPIDKENYLDFPIVEEDLKQLLEWFDTDHEDLKRKLGLPIVAVELDRVKEAFERIANPDEDKIKDIVSKALAIPHHQETIPQISDGLNFLVDNDPELLEIIGDLIGYVISTYGSIYEDSDMPNVSKDIQMSKHLGKGANLYSALKHLQIYGAPEGDGTRNLMAAIHYCLFELQRRKLHE